MAEYYTERGERLVTQGSRDTSTPGQRAQRALDRWQRANRTQGRCIVCERTGFTPYALDDSSRCVECQP